MERSDCSLRIRRHLVGIALIVGMTSLVGCANTPESLGSGSVGAAPIAAPSAASMEEAASAASPLVGKPAPAFRLRDAAERDVTLADLRGRWTVLYFYPKDDTPGCVCEATEFTDLLWKFHELGAAVYGVSADAPAEHRKFARKYALEITLLSDPDKSTMRAYGAWVDAGFGAEKVGRPVRSTFLLDPAGRVAWHWPEVLPEGHAERVRAKLAELSAGA